jgi:hypothetical protein
MIEIEPLEKILLLTLQSPYIKENERAVSLLIVADAEHGKTQAIFKNVKKLIPSKRIYYANNLTAKYIERNLLRDIIDGRIRHIIIPDFLNAIERGQATRKLFINFTKSLIDEGIIHVADAYGQFSHTAPVTCGMITAITKGNLKQNFFEWRNIGFLSRFIPFSYKYELNKIMKIIDNIFLDCENGIIKNKLKFKEASIADGIDYAQLKTLAITTGRSIEGIGIRMYKNLVFLARANAYLNGRTKTTKEDVEEIMRLSTWLNYEYNSL